MNDEQILNKGGDEYDIEQFAKQHGADLTKEDCLREDFIKNFLVNITSDDKIQAEILEKFYKNSFLSSIADYWLKVLADERARLVEEIEKMKVIEVNNHRDFTVNSERAMKSHNQALEDVINLIKNNE